MNASFGASIACVLLTINAGIGEVFMTRASVFWLIDFSDTASHLLMSQRAAATRNTEALLE
jgi:hypothetical protein